MKKLFFFILMVTVSSSYTQTLAWKASSPEAQGMSSLTLSNGIRDMQQAGTNIHSLLIIRNDHVVLDAAFYPYKQQYAHDIASVTKSVMALLIGIAIDKGFISSEQELVLNYFPGHAARTDAIKTLTIKDLLNMASGFQCSWDNREKELEQMQDRADWAAFMLDLPFVAKPGEKFSYCSGNFYLLSEILQKATKMKAHDFARRYLFDALGFAKSYWEANKKGINHGWGDLHITPYDMARIGALVLSQGKWKGKQIISAGWIQKIQPLYPVRRTESYGYGWWLDSENPDEIQAMGRGGQRMFVFKEKNMVIVATGGGFEAGDMDNLALDAIASYRPGENHYAELLQRVKQLQSPDTGRRRENHFSAHMLNKTYQLDNNDFEITSFRFEKGNDDYYLTFVFDDGGKEKLAMGMGNRYVLSRDHVFGLPLALKSYWNGNQLIVTYNQLSRLNLFQFSFVFNKDGVNVYAEDITNKRKAVLKVLR